MEYYLTIFLNLEKKIITATIAVRAAASGVTNQSPSSSKLPSTSIEMRGKMRALQSESTAASLLYPIADENDWHP